MERYTLIKHYYPHEMMGGPGTMAGCGAVIADSDAEAMKKAMREYNLTIDDISSDWGVEQKEFSLVRVIKPL